MPYLRLLHGRAEPDARPGSRGIDGPIFGPFSCFHRSGREIRLDESAGHVLRMHDGCVFYGGVYYGDWSVFAGPPTASEREFLVDFAPDLARTPRRNGQTGAACASSPVSDSKQLQVIGFMNEEKETTNMTNEKKRPVQEVRMGRIRAAIWENSTDKGVRHNVTISRLYKDGDDWRDSTSFGREDLLLVGKVADAAHSWIYEHGNGSTDTENVGDEPF